MSNILFTVNCIVPLFVMVGAGIVARTAGWIKEEHSGVLNKLCFYVFIPCMMIKSATSADFSQISDFWIYLYGMVSIVAAACLLSLAASRFIKDRTKVAALVHSGFRSNTMLLGTPLAINLLGEAGAFPAILMMMLATPVANACGVTVMSVFGQGERRRGGRRVVRDVFLNPVMIGLLVGMALARSGITLPTPISQPIQSFSAAATPIAMVSIGASFRLKRLVSDIRYVCFGALAKLVVLPLLFVVPLIALGFRSLPVLGIYLLHATPSASTSGILTEMLGGDGALSNEIILVSTAASVVTIFFGVMGLRYFGIL